jgi:hypothetical protein
MGRLRQRKISVLTHLAILRFACLPSTRRPSVVRPAPAADEGLEPGTDTPVNKLVEGLVRSARRFSSCSYSAGRSVIIAGGTEEVKEVKLGGEGNVRVERGCSLDEGEGGSV